MEKIKVGIIGLGNCASALIQGIGYYSKSGCDNFGLMHPLIGKYGPGDIEVSLAQALG
jgi:myo-inositol-1-phosphate synthase